MKLISLPITEVKIFDTPESVQALRDSLEKSTQEDFKKYEQNRKLVVEEARKKLLD